MNKGPQIGRVTSSTVLPGNRLAISMSLDEVALAKAGLTSHDVRRYLASQYITVDERPGGPHIIMEPVE